MDYYPVSYWDETANKWIECGRFYRNALVIDYNLMSDEQFQINMFKTNESVFAAPRFDVGSNWIDAPGSSNWAVSLTGNQLDNRNMVGIYRNDNGTDIYFGVDLPVAPPVGPRHKNIIAYDSWKRNGSFSRENGSNSKLYVKKIWNQPITLSALFDVYHDSINVKDISR